MAILYSASTNGFYDTNLPYKSLPNDAVEITPEVHQALMAAQTTGQTITSDTNGYPIAKNHAPPTPQQIGKSSYTLAVASGVTLQSKGTPAVNGTYDISQAGESSIIGLQVAAQNNLFPGYVRDINGAKILMTAAEFTASVAPAVLGYALALDNALDVSNAGGVWVTPANPVVIS